MTSARRHSEAPRQQVVQHLMFRLGTEDYAIEIEHVLEIRGYVPLTPIPNAPAHLKGVMNVRGTIIPVVDLRERFAMPPPSYDKFTVILVVCVQGKVSGMLVDAVTDIVQLEASDLEPPPDLGAHVDTSFIRGMAKASGRVLLVLDLEQTIREVMSYRNAVTSETDSDPSHSSNTQDREANR